jgi:hypothetical protein
MPNKISNLSPAFAKATASALAIAKKELQAAAKVHRVKINVDRVIYGSFTNTTIVVAPLRGIEKYDNADFSAGAPIQLVIVSSTKRTKIPNGAFVVRAQYRPRARSGKALFMDSNGTIAAQRDLIIRTAEESALLFPWVYTGPQNIPHVTSWHCFEKSPGDWAVDCAGWDPYRVLYY